MKKILLISLALITLKSCMIENCPDPVIGCTDPEAINYNPQADYTNNSCDYSSDVVFFLDANAAIYLDQQNVNQLTFYINNFQVGSQYNNNGFIFSLEDPNCGDPYFTNSNVNWSISNSTNIYWEARDETGYVWYNANEMIYPNQCLAIRLTTKNIKTSISQNQ